MGEGSPDWSRKRPRRNCCPPGFPLRRLCVVFVPNDAKNAGECLNCTTVYWKYGTLGSERSELWMRIFPSTAGDPRFERFSSQVHSAHQAVLDDVGFDSTHHFPAIFYESDFTITPWKFSAPDKREVSHGRTLIRMPEFCLTLPSTLEGAS